MEKPNRWMMKDIAWMYEHKFSISSLKSRRSFVHTVEEVYKPSKVARQRKWKSELQKKLE